ncbi:hypothetical protein HHI36_015830, partial [Cryptolaemus montrouzieri]
MAQVNIPEATCELLSSKHPNSYTSFRVCINANNFELAKYVNMWPEGALIKKFFDRVCELSKLNVDKTNTDRPSTHKYSLKRRSRDNYEDK